MVDAALHSSVPEGHPSSPVVPAAPRGLQDRVKTTLARLSQTGALPTMPAVAQSALAFARDPDADIDDLCRVIQSDVGLAARVLRAANSAAVGRRTPARKLPEAVITIGLRKTCDLVVAACARTMFPSSSRRAEELWRHALATAVAAEEVARVTRWIDPGRAFLPALFHDVGRIAFLLADETSLDVVDDLAASGGGTKSELEREWYGFDHEAAASILAEDWGLSLEQCDAIRWHHEPDEAGAARELAVVLHVADAIAWAIGYGVGPTAPSGRPSERLGLPAEQQLELLDRVRASFERQCDLMG